MSVETPGTTEQAINPALASLVKLLARFAVEDYLQEIGYAGKHLEELGQAKKKPTDSTGDT